MQAEIQVIPIPFQPSHRFGNSSVRTLMQQHPPTQHHSPINPSTDLPKQPPAHQPTHLKYKCTMSVSVRHARTTALTSSSMGQDEIQGQIEKISMLLREQERAGEDSGKNFDLEVVLRPSPLALISSLSLSFSLSFYLKLPLCLLFFMRASLPLRSILKLLLPLPSLSPSLPSPSALNLKIYRMSTLNLQQRAPRSSTNCHVSRTLTISLNFAHRSSTNCHASSNFSRKQRRERAQATPPLPPPPTKITGKPPPPSNPSLHFLHRALKPQIPKTKTLNRDFLHCAGHHRRLRGPPDLKECPGLSCTGSSPVPQLSQRHHRGMLRMLHLHRQFMSLPLLNISLTNRYSSPLPPQLSPLNSQPLFVH